ncbi:MAG: amylo-alpha-1,6-glucosidase [Cyanobacteria bacterium P01_H01_bin.35]
MTQQIYELYGKSFLTAPESNKTEWPYAIDFQRQQTLVIKDNDLFLITDKLGNTVANADSQKRTVTGLFCRDTRFLSRSELQIEGKSPVLLSSSANTGYSIIVDCTNPEINNLLKPESIGIKRNIVLQGGLFEEIEIRNYNTHAVEFQISLSFQVDFKDLFEVRNFSSRSQRGQNLADPFCENNRLNFAYQGLDDSLMESLINFKYRTPDRVDGNTVIWHLKIDSQASVRLGYCLQTSTNNQENSIVVLPDSLEEAVKSTQAKQDSWYQQITKIRTDSTSINQVIEQAENDIYLLLQSFGKGKILVAGIPWFSTLFGRDSLIAAGQTLMLDPNIARDTLLTLAQHQGINDSEWHDESPGKILHELRTGELARCQEIPHTPYYGTVDATPLWLMLYRDYYKWTEDRETIESLWENAIAAMNWIDTQCEATGYLSYLRRSPGGIQNQGWKDSGDCIVNSKGELVEGTITLCEVQGYVYAAKLGMSELAEIFGYAELSKKWQLEATELKERFNRDFWVESENYCALALDENGNAIDSVTSNPGHCLQLGIFTPEKATAVSARLGAKDMFSGWGIRTLSSLSPAYNPMGYHLGSVWPHDSALTAVGLRSMGKIEQAFAIAEGLMDMTKLQPNYRPPELFCGFPREANRIPVKYPVACFPQAWATGAIFQLLQMMVNLIPDAANNCLAIENPTLPKFINHLSVQNLKIGNNLVDLNLERICDTITCKVVKQQGDLRVLIEA